MKEEWRCVLYEYGMGEGMNIPFVYAMRMVFPACLGWVIFKRRSVVFLGVRMNDKSFPDLVVRVFMRVRGVSNCATSCDIFPF